MKISIFSLFMTLYFCNISLGHFLCPDEYKCDYDYVSYADCSEKQLQQLPKNLDIDVRKFCNVYFSNKFTFLLIESNQLVLNRFFSKYI